MHLGVGLLTLAAAVEPVPGLGWGDRTATRVTSLDPNDAWQIVSTPKGERPLPETYLPQEMIVAVPPRCLEGGVARIS